MPPVTRSGRLSLNNPDTIYTSEPPPRQQRFRAPKKSVRWKARRTRADERQKTMTQIGFVARSSRSGEDGSDSDEEPDEQDEDGGRGQRGIGSRKRKRSCPKQRDQTLTQMPNFFISATSMEDERSSDTDNSAASEYTDHASRPHPSSIISEEQESDRDLNQSSRRLPFPDDSRSNSFGCTKPYTPKHNRRLSVPFSQSPPTPVLSPSTTRPIRRSPLQERSINITPDRRLPLKSRKKPISPHSDHSAREATKHYNSSFIDPLRRRQSFVADSDDEPGSPLSLPSPVGKDDTSSFESQVLGFGDEGCENLPTSPTEFSSSSNHRPLVDSQEQSTRRALSVPIKSEESSPDRNMYRQLMDRGFSQKGSMITAASLAQAEERSQLDGPSSTEATTADISQDSQRLPDMSEDGFKESSAVLPPSPTSPLPSHSSPVSAPHGAMNDSLHNRLITLSQLLPSSLINSAFSQ